jgi:hypothetical protein
LEEEVEERCLGILDEGSNADEVEGMVDGGEVGTREDWWLDMGLE